MKHRFPLFILCGLLTLGCKTYQSILTPGMDGVDSVTLSHLTLGKSYEILLASDSVIEVKVLAADYHQLTCETKYKDSTALKGSIVVSQGEEVISSQNPGPTILLRENIKDVRERKTSSHETKKNIALTVGLALILATALMIENYVKSTF